MLSNTVPTKLTKIGISMRIVEAATYHEPRDCISQDWMSFLTLHNFLPILLPNIREKTIEYIEQIPLEGIILSGGNNLARLEHEPSELIVNDSYTARDHTEYLLLDYAISHKIPVLGVCRGLQVICSYFNSILHRDLSSREGATAHRANTHQVTIHDKAFENLYGSNTISVNSFHNQGVVTDALAAPLQVIAEANDNTVEAVTHENLPMVGITWHPERTNPSAKGDSALFSALFRTNNWREAIQS